MILIDVWNEDDCSETVNKLLKQELHRATFQQASQLSNLTSITKSWKLVNNYYLIAIVYNVLASAYMNTVEGVEWEFIPKSMHLYLYHPSCICS